VIKLYSKSDIGIKRMNNQDFCDTGYFDDGTAWIIVCDGMGGANGGNIASEIATEKTKEYLLKNYKVDSNLEKLLTDAVETSNKIIYELSVSDEALSGMGTTIVAAIIKDGFAHVLHVGDSRAYIVRKDEIEQITIDHSMVQELLMLGSITALEAKNHPQRNIITRALGVRSEVDTEFDKVEFKNDEKLLLCTDGLTTMVEDEDIIEIFDDHNADELAAALIDAANVNGGNDNITVAIAEYEV